MALDYLPTEMDRPHQVSDELENARTDAEAARRGKERLRGLLARDRVTPGSPRRSGDGRSAGEVKSLPNAPNAPNADPLPPRPPPPPAAHLRDGSLRVLSTSTTHRARAEALDDPNEEAEDAAAVAAHAANAAAMAASAASAAATTAAAEELSALRAHADEMERELQQLRARQGRQDAASRAKVSRLASQLQSLEQQRGDFSKVRALLEAQTAQAVAIAHGKKPPVRSVATATESVSRWADQIKLKDAVNIPGRSSASSASAMAISTSPSSRGARAPSRSTSAVALRSPRSVASPTPMSSSINNSPSTVTFADDAAPEAAVDRGTHPTVHGAKHGAQHSTPSPRARAMPTAALISPVEMARATAAAAIARRASLSRVGNTSPASVVHEAERQLQLEKKEQRRRRAASESPERGRSSFSPVADHPQGWVPVEGSLGLAWMPPDAARAAARLRRLSGSSRAGSTCSSSLKHPSVSSSTSSPLATVAYSPNPPILFTCSSSHADPSSALLAANSSGGPTRSNLAARSNLAKGAKSPRCAAQDEEDEDEDDEEDEGEEAASAAAAEASSAAPNQTPKTRCVAAVDPGRCGSRPSASATTPPVWHPAHQPEVRLHFESGVALSPEEVHAMLLQPAGVALKPGARPSGAHHASDGVLAVISVGLAESRVACRSWREAYQLLTYVTPEVQRQLGIRCRPAVLDGVPLTRTQMCRLAQSEGDVRSPHVTRAGITPRGSDVDADWRARLRE